MALVDLTDLIEGGHECIPLAIGRSRCRGKWFGRLKFVVRFAQVSQHGRSVRGAYPGFVRHNGRVDPTTSLPGQRQR
jgi:hypothetical protein